MSVFAIRRQTALADTRGSRATIRASSMKLCLAPIVRTGSFASETAQGISDAYTADYELGYDNGYAAALAGKPYNTTGVADEPVSTKNPYGRSAAAYKSGYGKGYPAGQYQQAKNNSMPLPPLPTGVDPAKPELPPPPTPAELKLPPLGSDADPKLGDQPKDTKNTAGWGGFVFVTGLALVVVAGIFFATKVA